MVVLWIKLFQHYGKINLSIRKVRYVLHMRNILFMGSQFCFYKNLLIKFNLSHVT